MKSHRLLVTDYLKQILVFGMYLIHITNSVRELVGYVIVLYCKQGKNRSWGNALLHFHVPSRCRKHRQNIVIILHQYQDPASACSKK